MSSTPEQLQAIYRMIVDDCQKFGEYRLLCTPKHFVPVALEAGELDMLLHPRYILVVNKTRLDGQILIIIRDTKLSGVRASRQYLKELNRKKLKEILKK